MAVGTIDTTPQSAQCSSDGAGARLCSASFSVKPGTYVYALAAFDRVNALGAKLSTTSGQLVVRENQANVLHAVLDGIVSGLALSLNPSTVTQGAGANVQVNLSALDPDGNVILTGSYADADGNPVNVTLGTSDTSGMMQLSQTTVNNVTPATLRYNGGRVPSQIVTAKAPNLSGAAATLVVAAPASVLANTINTVTLMASPAKISNPTGPWLLTAAVVGADGKPAAGETVSFAATAGALGVTTATTDTSGVATTTIGPPSGTSSVVAVTASAGTKSSVVNVRFAPQTIPTSKLRRKPSSAARLAMGYIGVPLSAVQAPSNPFLSADPCYVPTTDTTPSVQCKSDMDQQHLTTTQLLNAVQVGCTLAQNTLDDIETGQCLSFGVEVVSCVAAATGFGTAVCLIALSADENTTAFTGETFAQACVSKLVGVLAQHYNASFVADTMSFAKDKDLKGALVVACDLLSEYIKQIPTPLMFTLSGPTTYLKTTEGARVDLTALGGGFNDVDTITFTPNGTSGGPVTWSKYDGTMAAAKNARQLVIYGDGQMSMSPTVTHIGDRAGLTTWTVAVTDLTGTLKSQTFTVDYEPPLLTLTSVKEFAAYSNMIALAPGPNGYIWFLAGRDGFGRIQTSTGAFEGFADGGPRFTSVPSGITLGADGAMWISEAACSICDQWIATVANDGVVTERLVGSGGSAEGIALGPDGAFWLTVGFYTFPGQSPSPAGGILRYVPGTRLQPGAGTRMFLLPLDSATPHSIVFAPDGALWFTEGDNGVKSKIGRITTDGAISEFTIPTANSYATGIAVGDDGSLWFTEANANKIGKMSLSGVLLNEFSIPTEGASPAGITKGRDGALWFAEYGANAIGRVTTSGTFSEFKTPSQNSAPMSIAAGPDGNIWFTEYKGAAIGRISP